MVYVFYMFLILIGIGLFFLFAILGLVGKIKFKSIFKVMGVIFLVALIGLIFGIRVIIEIARSEAVKTLMSTAEQGNKEELNSAYQNGLLKISCEDKEVIINTFTKPRKSDTGYKAMAQKLADEGADNKKIKEEVEYTYENLKKISCSNKHKSIVKQYFSE